MLESLFNPILSLLLK